MADQDQGESYRIRVRGALDTHWADWFNGLTMRVETNPSGHPVTLLEGRIRDQSALQGILNKLIDLNLPLLEVEIEEYGDEPQPEE